MAKVDLDTALNSVRGSVGNMILRRHKGGTVWQKRPERKMPWSRQQKAHRAPFGCHVAYARSAERDAAGKVVAAGEARNEHEYWRYAVQPPPAGANPITNIVVTVFDRPGNFAIGKFDLTKRANARNECAPFGA